MSEKIEKKPAKKVDTKKDKKKKLTKAQLKGFKGGAVGFCENKKEA